jgi:hypothetical protein
VGRRSGSGRRVKHPPRHPAGQGFWSKCRNRSLKMWQCQGVSGKARRQANPKKGPFLPTNAWPPEGRVDLECGTVRRGYVNRPSIQSAAIAHSKSRPTISPRPFWKFLSTAALSIKRQGRSLPTP